MRKRGVRSLNNPKGKRRADHMPDLAHSNRHARSVLKEAIGTIKKLLADGSQPTDEQMRTLRRVGLDQFVRDPDRFSYDIGRKTVVLDGTEIRPRIVVKLR